MDPTPTDRRHLLRLALGWLLAGAVTAVVLIVVLQGFRAAQTIPALEQTDLQVAAREAGCRLLRGRTAARSNPPADGAPSAPAAAAGVYDDQPPMAELLAAVRRGTVVVHYRSPGSASLRRRLEAVRSIVPAGTIVTANGTDMPYAVAAVGWRRLIGCPRTDRASVEALRLFRARNLGRGPDGPP